MIKNRITWITGASSGIGREIAIHFASKGENVAVSSRGQDGLERLRKEINIDDKSFLSLPLDISNSNLVTVAAKAISDNFKLDCLINNAGITSFKPAEENSLREIKEIINTNLTGAIFAIKAVLPYMIKNKKGTIINVLSVAAKKIFSESSVYSASKAGLLAYTNVLREEVRKYNIRVINVLPGPTRTPIWPNDVLEENSERMMSPADIAKLIYNTYSIDSNMVVEELLIRPMKGDL